MKLLNGKPVPQLGLGTFGIGGKFSSDNSRDEEWLEAIKAALKMGYRLVDTAESYGDGHAEELLSQAISGFDRESLFIVSKLSPENCRFTKLIKAGKRIVKRLGTSMDLCLLHMPPDNIKEAIYGLEKLADMNITRYIGVSNFSPKQLIEAFYALRKHPLSAVQAELSLVEQNLDLLNFCKNHNTRFMAYRPLAAGDLVDDPRLKEMADKHGKTEVQTALRWVLDTGALTLVKSESKTHLRENLGALGWTLGDDWDVLRDKFLSKD